MTADGIREHLWARPMARRHHLFPLRHKAIGLQKKVTNRSKHLFTASSMPEPCITYHITRISRHDYFHRFHIAEAEIRQSISAHTPKVTGHWNPRNWVWESVWSLPQHSTAFSTSWAVSLSYPPVGSQLTPTQWRKPGPLTTRVGGRKRWTPGSQTWRGTFQSNWQTPPMSSVFYSSEPSRILFIKTTRSYI